MQSSSPVRLRESSSAKWMLTGKVMWTTELHKTEVGGLHFKRFMSDESTPGFSASFSCGFCIKG